MFLPELGFGGLVYGEARLIARIAIVLGLLWRQEQRGVLQSGMFLSVEDYDYLTLRAQKVT